MDEQLAELLKSLKAAQDILSAEQRRHASRRRIVRADPAADLAGPKEERAGDRTMSLGDLAAERGDRERE